MPTIKCDVCTQLNRLKIKDYKYIDRVGPFACSVDCTNGWIVTNGSRPDPLEMYRSSICIKAMERPIECYSKILGKYFRSNFEMHFAEWAVADNHRYMYEALSFKWGSKVFTPDFYFPADHCFVEVKGKWGAGQHSKYTEFRHKFPRVALLVVPWILSSKFREVARG